jgi:integrase
LEIAMSAKGPSYREHAGGQGFATYKGVNKYFGKYGLDESLQKYHDFTTEWIAKGRPHLREPTVPTQDMTVNELLVMFWEHAEKTYTKHGKPTSQLPNFKYAIKVVRESFGGTPARSFDDVALERVRDAIIDQKRLCTRETNRRVELIRQIFRWATRKRLIPAEVLTKLATVQGLRSGQRGTRNHSPTGPVSKDHVDAVLGLLTPQLAAMVQVQMICGMRPGEVCLMRGCDIDSRWIYRPHRHKVEHHNRERIIYVLPAAQAILKPWIDGRDPEEYLFQPKQAKVRRRLKSNPKRAYGVCYSVAAYRHSVERACRRVGIPEWHPHQLRHAGLTEIFQKAGIGAAMVQAGHVRQATTETYLHDRFEAAKAAMDRM